MSHGSVSDDRKVTVTITPGGNVTDITVGGASIAHAVPAGGVDLTMGHQDLPRLALLLVPHEIIVKEPDEPASDPQAG